MNCDIWICAGNLFIPGKPDKKTILEAIIKSEKAYSGENIDITEMQKLRKYRRNDRFSIISELGMEEMKDFFSGEDDNRDIATVFSTFFGPISTNILFIKSIYDESSVPSPTVFSHTVNNAALGHLCKDYGLKGPSTLLLSGNPIGVAAKLLTTGKAEKALVQGVEEYSENLQEIYRKKQIAVNEALSRVILSGKKEKGTKSKLVVSRQTNVWGHPLYDIANICLSEIARSIIKAAEDFCEPEMIDFVLINSFDDKIIEVQRKAVKEAYKNSKIINLYESLGTVLGADLCSQLVVADLLIKEGHVTMGHYCMINSLDISGNYVTCLVREEA